MSNDCKDHPKEVAGISDMKGLAEMIGDLHYEQLHYLFFELHKKFKRDSRRDWKEGKAQLSNRLKKISVSQHESYIQAGEAWQISKPFMEVDNKTKP